VKIIVPDPIACDPRWAFSQVEEEFRELETICAQGRSCLEIGSLLGGSAKRLAMAMPAGSKMVCIDQGFERTSNTLPMLLHSLQSIEGRDVTLILGDSTSDKVVAAASKLAPFDLVFIDGSHEYDAVLEDWNNYGPLGKIIAFHDIVSCQGAKGAWAKIREGRRYKEFMHGTTAGTGVLWR